MKLLPNCSTKRALLVLTALWPLTGSPAGTADGADAVDTSAQARFQGIGLVLVTDAVPDVRMRGVMFYDEHGVELYSKGALSQRNREILAISSGRIPQTVRVIWRDNPKAIWGRLGIDYEGTIIGDHVVDVAQRIPNEVVKDIRAHGGALRLKFRLAPDGVLFGWDIERPGGGISKFDMPGGDFLDTRY